MKNLYILLTVFFVCALFLMTGCAPGSIVSENSTELIHGTLFHNQGVEGKITIDATTAKYASCNGAAYITKNFIIYSNKKGTFNLSCENDLNIKGKFEMVTKNPDHGFGEGWDQQGNMYYFIFSLKENT